MCIVLFAVSPERVAFFLIRVARCLTDRLFIYPFLFNWFSNNWSHRYVISRLARTPIVHSIRWTNRPRHWTWTWQHKSIRTKKQRLEDGSSERKRFEMVSCIEGIFRFAFSTFTISESLDAFSRFSYKATAAMGSRTRNFNENGDKKEINKLNKFKMSTKWRALRVVSLWPMAPSRSASIRMGHFSLSLRPPRPEFIIIRHSLLWERCDDGETRYEKKRLLK